MYFLFSGCNCHVEGTVNGNECNEISGNCTCLDGYTSDTVQVTCNLCDEGFYNINSGTSNPLTCRGINRIILRYIFKDICVTLFVTYNFSCRC